MNKVPLFALIVSLAAASAGATATTVAPTRYRLEGEVIIADPITAREHALAADEQGRLLAELRDAWPARQAALRRAIEEANSRAARVAQDRDVHYAQLRADAPDEYARLAVASRAAEEAQQRAQRAQQLLAEIPLRVHNARLCMLNARRAELQGQAERAARMLAAAESEAGRAIELAREIAVLAGESPDVVGPAEPAQSS